MRGRANGYPPVRSRPRDHPRVCGEEGLTFHQMLRPTGSPPRMRGRDLKYFMREASDGITPAYAGKSPPTWTPPCLRGDHPRVCGEEVERTCSRSPQRGSPPRMRGRESCFADLLLLTRITPAYAGKSSTFGKAGGFPRDHPRVCGEELLGAIRLPNTAGSPPRMRGRAIIGTSDKVYQGITPAYAGKSWELVDDRCVYGDHPRVCGEENICGPCSLAVMGSPPRMRGRVCACFS